MRRIESISILFICSLTHVFSQGKWDYKWIIGYDPSLLDSVGQVIQLDFMENPRDISILNSVSNFWMEGSNTSMCDKEGNLIFYSNGCKIINARGDIMVNGDEINPGKIQDLYCPYGGSPIRQGVIAISGPENDSLYYVFNLDWDQPYLSDPGFLGVAPQRLYYQVIDMTKDFGNGAVTKKNQIAVQDTFARGNIQAARHANGKDWWVIVPKSHSNCYFLILINKEGVQPAQLLCSGKIWSDEDSGAQAVLSPNLKKYIRFNAWNGLNIFDFDNSTGELSNPVEILFPKDTINFIGGVAVSPNSQYAYVSARKSAYQFDLMSENVEASKIKIAEWDGFYNPNATLFYLSALAPDGKIYISNSSSTFNLHVIHKPNCPGLSCEIEQHGINLPSYNFASIPNLPHYRISTAECDTSVAVNDIPVNEFAFHLYPNPANDFIYIDLQEIQHDNFTLTIFNIFGQTLIRQMNVQSFTQIDVSELKSGTYYLTFQNQKNSISGKFVKIE